MKLSIGAILCITVGAAAFIQQPTKRTSAQAQAKLSMASETNMDDRRSFVTKVRADLEMIAAWLFGYCLEVLGGFRALGRHVPSPACVELTFLLAYLTH